MNAVGDNLYGHVLKSIDTLHGAWNLKFVFLINHRHGVIEVGCVRHASLKALEHVLVCGVCVSDGR